MSGVWCVVTECCLILNCFDRVQTADDTISYSYYERKAISGAGGGGGGGGGGSGGAAGLSVDALPSSTPPGFLTGQLTGPNATAEWQSPEQIGLLHRSDDRTFAPTNVVSTANPIAAAAAGATNTATTTTTTTTSRSVYAVTASTNSQLTTSGSGGSGGSGGGPAPAPAPSIHAGRLNPALLQSPSPGSPSPVMGGGALNPNTSSASSSTASVSGVSALTSPNASGTSASPSPSPQPGAAAVSVSNPIPNQSAAVAYNSQSLVEVAAVAAKRLAATDSPLARAVQPTGLDREQQAKRDAHDLVYRENLLAAATANRVALESAAAAASALAAAHSDSKHRAPNSGAAVMSGDVPSFDGSTRSTYNWRASGMRIHSHTCTLRIPNPHPHPPPCFLCSCVCEQMRRAIRFLRVSERYWRQQRLALAVDHSVPVRWRFHPHQHQRQYRRSRPRADRPIRPFFDRWTKSLVTAHGRR